MKELGASLITMRHLCFERDIKIIEDIGGVDYLHVDIMDGHYVPRYGIYPEIIQEITKISNIPLDIHLMVEDISFSISQIDKISNIDSISFHYFKNEGKIFKYVDQIKELNAKPILVVDLSTPMNAIVPLIESGELDGVMFMGIHPGVLVQRHRPNTVIAQLKELMSRTRLPDNFKIQIDGGFSFNTAQDLARAGINSFVGGSSSIFHNTIDIVDEVSLCNHVSKNIQEITRLIGR